MSNGNAALRREFSELALVAAGAIPGALLRWQFEGLAHGLSPELKGLMAADLGANLLGCLLLGLLTAGPRPRVRLMLWGGIGFCGSLTTFSSWMLEVVRALDQGDGRTGLRLLLVSLVGGLTLVSVGRAAGARWFSRVVSERETAERPGSH